MAQELNAANVIPFSERIEKVVTGTLITYPDTFADAESFGVSDSWFFLPASKAYWNTLSLIFRERGSAVTPEILVARLEAQGLLESVGGHVGVMDTISAGCGVALFSSYLCELRKTWLRREAVLKLADIRDNPDADLSAIINDLREMYREPKRNEKKLPDYVKQAVNKLERILVSGSCVTGLRTGFTALDDALGGLNGGTLTVVGARPAMGKSIMGQNVAFSVAHHLKESNSAERVLFLTAEMSSEEIAQRLIQQSARFNFRNVVKTGQKTLTRAQMMAFKATARLLKRLPLDIWDVSGMNISRICHQVESEHQKNTYALIVVDYLQLIKGDSKKAQENTVEQVAEVSQGLKNLAKLLNVPVMALAQVNREAAKGGKAPTLADLKGSGAIEQDADAVLLLHRPAYYAENKQELTPEQLEEMQLILAKNRHGETGIFKARFLGDIFSIESVSD